MSTPNRSILIFTSSHLCRNPRVVKEAYALGSLGYSVKVLSMSTHTRFSNQDRELLKGAPFEFKAIDFASSSLHSRLSYLKHRGFTWLAKLLLKWCKIESRYCLGPIRPLLDAALSETADLTILHTEIPLLAAPELVRQGRRLAVDLEDWYSEDLLFADRKTRPNRLLSKAESFALNHSIYSSTTSSSMAKAVSDAYGCDALGVVRNVFPLHPSFRDPDTACTNVPSIIWFSQTVGPGRGLELFLAAWSRMKNPSTLSLLGDVRPGYELSLRQKLNEEQNMRLRFIPLVPPSLLPTTLSQHDIGLALEPRFPKSRDLTITNKLFQYMTAGLAVIATDTTGQKEVFNESHGIGVLVQAHETGLLARQLDGLVSNRKCLAEMQRESRRAACATYCWERESRMLASLVERAIGGPRPC